MTPEPGAHDGGGGRLGGGTDPAGPPTAWIEGCVVAQRTLDTAIAGLRDDQARGPSLLEGWSVGHLLTHIARNADSVVWRLDGAALGELRDQYPGGLAQRRDDIESGAGRPASELVADVGRTSAAVEAAMARLSESAWDGLSRTSRGVVEPARDAVFSRWREVVVHHHDLGLGPVEWPHALVATWLPLELPRLADRAHPGQLMAWVIGRGPAPSLEPW